MGAEHSKHSTGGQLDLLGDIGASDLETPRLNTSSLKRKKIDLMPLANESNSRNTPEMLLIVDTETTGLDPLEDECIEVGAILFHVSSRSVIAQQSFLLPVFSNSAEAINRIPPAVTRLDQTWQDGLIYFKKLIDSADGLVAHNSDFDRKWFGKDPLPEVCKPWLCTMAEISWPVERQLKARPSVRDLALAYEVPVWNAHRALTDCIYLSEVFRRCDELETLLVHGLEPRRLMRAKVSYEERHLAKKAGFTWNEPVHGAWTRRLSEREVLALDFPVLPLQNDH